MDFSLDTLPGGLAWAGGVLALAALIYEARQADWRTLISGPVLGRLLGAAVMLMLLWSLKANLAPGFRLHLLGVTVAVLTFGRARAIFAIAIGSLASAIGTSTELAAWPFNFVLLGVLPAWLSHVADRLLQARLPNHLFVFIFANACAVSAACMLAVGVGASLVQALGGAAIGPILEDYLPYFLLLGFAEAWLSGMAATLLVVFCPGWVASFDDRRYLLNK
ncbi:energy-coupling factor ABC transporter permease [Niveibacterium sp.]|uniref:energy-coupling factor ABC transporter permease n=1 Tax=Niveibacterium sp. TaxID=2017444 RepID=UPI0035AF459C